MKINHFRGIDDLTLRYPAEPGLYLVTGDNQLSPALGSNGVGKTTLLDAVSWALMGKTGGGIFGPKVIARGKKSARVVVTSSLGEVCRVQSPNRLELDRAEIVSEELERRLDLEQWFQAVHHAQDRPLFLSTSVSPTDRALLLADLIHANVWEDALVETKIRLQHAESDLLEADMVLSRLQGEITEAQYSLQRYEKQKEELEEQYQKARAEEEHRVRTLKQEVEYSEKAIDDADRFLSQEVYVKIDNLEKLIKEQDEQLAAQRTRARELERDIETNRRLLKDKLDHADRLSGMERCPTCEQEVAHAHKQAVQRQANELGLGYQRTIRELTNALAGTTALLSRVEEERSEHQNSLVSEKKVAKTVEDERENLRRTRTGALAKLESLRDWSPLGPQLATLRKIEQELVAHKERQQGLTDNHKTVTAQAKLLQEATNDLNFWKKQFPQIRVWAITLVTDQFNLMVQRHLRALGLPGWELRLVPSTTRVQQRLDVEVKMPGDEDFGPLGQASGGEHQRLLIAGQLTLAELVSTSWGIEYWDEPSSYLSGSGLEDLMYCLKEHAHYCRKQVFVVDHTMTDFAFDGILRLSKGPEGVSARWSFNETNNSQSLS